MKHILYFQWHSFMNQGIERAMKKMHMEYDTYFYQFTDWEKDDVFLDKFRDVLRKKEYDCVFSVNFSPLISMLCEEKGIVYVSWVYDSPIHIRNIESLKNNCNRIYFFDRGQADMYREMGIPAYHLPLAVDTELWSEKIRSKGSKMCASDISFVGQLYQTEYPKYTSVLPEYEKGYLEGIINAQSKIYGGYLLDELLSQEFVDQLNVRYDEVTNHEFQIEKRELEYMLNCEITWRERYMALALLANKYEVSLYASQKYDLHTGIKQKGYADYYEDMPCIFGNSKINLNISLKAIRTGIPLRVLDIMGCGGFLLTNYQTEMSEHFVIGEEIEIYSDLGDLREKVDFYLANENVRQQIADKGLQKVRQEFTFERRIEEILKNI